MAWFRSRDTRSGGPGIPPPWASFFTNSEYREFVRLVCTTLDRQHLLYELGDGQVKVYDPVETILGLANVAQRCHAARPAAWHPIIEHHLRVTLSAMTEHVPLSRDGAEASIRIRLMDVDVAAVYEVTARPAMPGAVAALFVDRPDSVESVNDAMVDAWGIPPDRLFSLAEQNTRRLESASHSTMYSPEGVEIHVLYGPSLFTASHALWPTDWLTDSLRPEVGVLLACPTRHVVLAHVVAGRSVLQAIPTLSALTAQRYADGPGSLFRSLWWWRDGIAHPVRIDPSGRVIVDAEDPLTEWLNQLTAGETQ